MKRPALVLAALSLTVLCLGLAAAAWSAETGSAAPGLKNPFFALCMDTHDAKKRTLAEQAEMLKTLGYDGAAHLWLDAVPERLRTLDAKGLKLCQIYLRVSIDPKQPKFDPRLGEVCKLLAGRDVTFGLLIGGGRPSDPAGDERAVAILREIGEIAAGSNLRVAMYPHVGDWVEKTSDAVRVARKVDRKNVGVMFNLCHWLKADDPGRLDQTLREAMPYLFVVTINGADAPPGNWDRLIQPLGSGSYDVGHVLRLLHQMGYRGPIGLQCYGLGGDAAVHLKKSIEAWKKLSAEAARKDK